MNQQAADDMEANGITLFICGNGNCIPQDYVCNGHDHCGDRSDEPGDCMTTCGGTYSSLRGAIESPSYPDPYPDNADCIYIISLPTGTIIGLSTEVFDIEHVGDCGADSLEIRDGGSIDSPSLGKFCGTDLPSSIQSTQNNMWIR